MRPRHLAAGLVPALAVLLGAAPLNSPDAALRGCSARPDSEAEQIMDWGLTVDGEIVYSYRNDDPEGEAGFGAAVRELDTSRIRSAGVICWARVDRMYGVRYRHGIYSIWTTDVFDGADDFLREAYDLRTSGGDVATLALPHPELILTDHPVAEGDGFALELTHPKHHWVCRIGSVDLPPHPHAHFTAEDRRVTAGRPDCFSTHDHGGSGDHGGR